jgi:hypothetical protein
MTFSEIAKDISDRFAPVFREIAKTITEEFPIVEGKIYSSNDKDLAVYKSFALCLNCFLPDIEEGFIQNTIIINLTQRTITSPINVNVVVSWAHFESDIDGTELILFPKDIIADEDSFIMIEENMPKIINSLESMIRKFHRTENDTKTNDLIQ